MIRRLYAECIITSNQEKASLTVDVSAPFLCHVIRVIVAAPDAGSMPAPTGGGTHPVNPLPAKRIPADVRSLCRSYTGEAMRSLAAIMRNGDKDATRVSAAQALLDSARPRSRTRAKTATSG